MNHDIETFLAMRSAILKELGERSLKKKLSERKEKDGSLTYQKVLDRIEEGEKEIPVTFISKGPDNK
jgi:hypothetical protein